MPRRLQAISLITLLLLAQNISAKSDHIYYKKEHDTCRLKLWDTFDSNEDLKYKDVLIEYLQEKNYSVTMLEKNKRIITGDYHLNFSWLRSGTKMFKDCSVEVKMYKSKVNLARKSDDLIFENSKKRSFPRHTPSGVERCKRAIKDVTRALPHCILMKK